jgi:acetolactate decarboxylase
LAEVVAKQHVTDLSDVDGTLVGFRFPGPLDGVEMAGWHLHFVTADRAWGGHVLDCELPHGIAQLDHATDMHVELPPRVGRPHGGDDDELLGRLERGG